VAKQKRGKRAVRGRKGAAKPEVGAGLRVSGESILDMVARITHEVPESDWARVPPDLSKNIGYYLYGSKKTDE
jgi:hypothetical protein